MNTFEEGEIKEIPNDKEVNGKPNHSGSYTWNCSEKMVQKLSKAKHSQAFESKKFDVGGFKWFLRVYPNGSGKNNTGFVNLFLYLASSLPQNISKIRCKYSIMCLETDTKWSHIKDYKATAKGSGWSNHRLSRDKLFKFTKFSFEVHLILLGVFDLKNELIGDKALKQNEVVQMKKEKHPSNEFEQLKQCINVLSQKIDQIQMNVDEIIIKMDEKNETKINGFMMQDLMQHIKKELSIQNGYTPFNVKEWLNNIECCQYIDLFSQINSIQKIQLMTKNDISALGVKSSSDIEKLWIAIQSLKSLHL